MSLKHLKVPLSRDQIQRRKDLAQKLYYEKEVQEFLNETGCPYEVYELNISKFKRWLEAKRKALSYSKIEIEEDIYKGEYLDLRYDSESKTVYEVIARVPYFYELENEKAFLSKYKIFPLAKNLQGLRFQKLDLEKEKDNLSYLKVVQKLLEFHDNSASSFYLFGDVGVGKTYLAACLSNAFALDNKSVVFTHVPGLLNYLKNQFSSPRGQEEIMTELKKTDLLVLDDLGAEPITAWSRDEILLSLINDRMENNRKTLITSNYNPELLIDLYRVDHRGKSDEIRARRLVDRLLSFSEIHQIVGSNRRRKF